MTASPDLLNSVASTVTLTTYDRSYGGMFENPWEGLPSLTFYMQRATFRDADDALITVTSLPNLREAYAPAKAYQLMDPTTGSPVPDQTFTSEQLYAMLYSVMIEANKTAAAARAAEAAAALAALQQQAPQPDPQPAP